MKNENVICVKLEELSQRFDMQQEKWHVNEAEIDSLTHCFIPRSVAETDYSHKQLIPYAIVTDTTGRVLVYQRCGSEQRLAGICSAGIGGHVNDQDKGNSVFEILTNGLRREILEEIGADVTTATMTLCGMINEEQTEVGHCHTGVVFRLILDPNSLHYDSEIGNPRWEVPSDLDLSKFELWSSLALTLAINP